MNRILFIAGALLSISACNPSGTEKSDQKNDSLISVINDRDSALYAFILSFNKIESNLDSVAAKQKIIAVYTYGVKGELKSDRKAQINAEIAAINNLMDKNRKEIEQLNNKIKGSKTKNVLLEKTVKTLTIQLSQKEYELSELNMKMNTLNAKFDALVTTLDSLSQHNYIQSIIIDYQTADLNTAYYIVGESKELKDKNIIDKKGGLLGIGKTATLSKDFDNSMFTLINLSQTTSIPINGSDVTLVTNHPSGSFTLVNDDSKKGNIKMITITNPTKFWSVSHYLVIAKK